MAYSCGFSRTIRNSPPSEPLCSTSSTSGAGRTTSASLCAARFRASGGPQDPRHVCHHRYGLPRIPVRRSIPRHTRHRPSGGNEIQAAPGGTECRVRRRRGSGRPLRGMRRRCARLPARHGADPGHGGDAGPHGARSQGQPPALIDPARRADESAQPRAGRSARNHPRHEYSRDEPHRAAGARRRRFRPGEDSALPSGKRPQPPPDRDRSRRPSRSAARQGGPDRPRYLRPALVPP